ncbi:hypothetical protein GCM10023091_14290 [Ravibacter arvi]|uniref:Cyclic nucleotide-binding domain-containing protein n=1 Tax=Ravibacter arvi TaxID=2051041 RepID=A0ABP8LVC5_9BACT
MNELFQNLELHVPLSQQVREDISRFFTTVTVPAQTRLILAGQLHPPLYYVREGVLRNFEVFDEKESTNWFFKKGDFAFSMESLLLGKPSEGHLESCVEATLYSISKADFWALVQKYDSIRNLSNMLAGIYLREAKKHVHYSIHLSAWQRYRLFLADNPYIANRVQSNHVASFLGIFPGSVSRFRRRISTEDSLP